MTDLSLKIILFGLGLLIGWFAGLLTFGFYFRDLNREAREQLKRAEDLCKQEEESLKRLSKMLGILKEVRDDLYKHIP